MFGLIQKPRLFICLQQFTLEKMERKLLISLSNTVEKDMVKDLIQEEIVKMGLKVHDKGQQNDGAWAWVIGYESQADKISIQIFIKKLQVQYNSNLCIQQLNQQIQTKVSQKGKVYQEKVKENNKDVNQQGMNKKREQKDSNEGNDSFQQLSESSDGFQELENGGSLEEGKSQGFEGDEQDVKEQDSDKSAREQKEQIAGLVQLCSQSAQQSVAQEIQQQQHALENQSIEKQAQNVGNDKYKQKRTITKVQQQSRQIEHQLQRQRQIQKVQIEDNEDIENIDDTTEVLIKYYECKLKQRYQQNKQEKQEKQSDKKKQEQQQLISRQSLRYLKDLQQQVVVFKEQKNEQIFTVGKNRDQQQKQNRAEQQKPLGQIKQSDTNQNKGQWLIDNKQGLIYSKYQYELINSRYEEKEQEVIKNMNEQEVIKNMNEQEVIKNMNEQESIEFKIKFQYEDIEHQPQNQKIHLDQKQQQQLLHLQQQLESYDIKQQQASHVNEFQQQINQSVQIQHESPRDQHFIIQHRKQFIPRIQQQYSQSISLDESCHQLLSKPIKQTPINTNLSYQLRHQHEQKSQDSLQLSQNSLTYINQPQQQQEYIKKQKQTNIFSDQQQNAIKQIAKTSHNVTPITQTITQKREPIMNKALLQMKNMQPSIQITKKQPLKQETHKQPSVQMMQDKQQSDRLYPTTVQNLTSDDNLNTTYPLKRSSLKYKNQRQSSQSSSFSLSYYNNQRYVIMCLLTGVLVFMCYLFYL